MFVGNWFRQCLRLRAERVYVVFIFLTFGSVKLQMAFQHEIFISAERKRDNRQGFRFAMKTSRVSPTTKGDNNYNKVSAREVISF